MDKSNMSHTEVATFPDSHVVDSYAVDSKDEQVTVIGTMGQDPDHKTPVSWRAWAIVAICALAAFQNTYFGIAPAANQYAISGALQGTASERIWIVQAGAVPAIAFGPIFAIISDVYGRRNMILCAWVLFAVGSLVSMTATSMTAVIAGQVLSGVASGISGIMFAVASEVIPGAYRAYGQTIVSWVSGLSSLVALLPIGAATTADPVNGWRWVFRIKFMLECLIVIGFAALYFPPPRTAASKQSLGQKLKALDWIGYVLLLGALVPFLMGFAWSGDSNYGWASKTHTVVPVVVGGVLFIVCLIYEWKGTKTGFLDHRLFQNGRNFPLCMILIAVEGSLFYLMNNIYPSQVNGIWETPGTIKANAYLLPFFMVITVISPFLSVYVTKYRDVKWPIFIGFISFSASVIGLALSGTSGKLGLAFNGVGGLGFAPVLILIMVWVQNSTPPLFIGTASALTISSRTLGGTVGLGIANAIYGSLTNTQIPEAIVAAVAPLGFNPQHLGQLIGFYFSGQGLDKIPGINGQILGAGLEALHKTEAHAYKIVWLSFLPGCIIAAGICLFMRNSSERMNWVVDAPLETKSDALSAKEQAFELHPPTLNDDIEIERVERR
ncbi:MFS general substrate transporter [Aureobasidium pullulans]|uniref:MFS general substrate transporter n=1 Tax=Aureobasidium pullulans TaxID=5580 RepID=A0A4S9C583_AURPU|nr:MFS general substrate transporter [Aureobasidium pullulans]THX82047.1 MFS general substrate transporter [Aureobasidium pullulans]